MNLLLLADPLESKVRDYLNGATCFGAFVENELVSVCVVNSNTDGEIELFNIASFQNMQGQGIGTKLLEFVISELKNRNVTKLILGTGTFGHQLAFYQRLGFRAEEVFKNFFVDNYDEPIYENGLQHYDMLRFTLHM
ncbi:GNAT family N-acetyltransferase [Shewanella psychropiezotolerans]|uniref:GNAT family N-acetyltransferase n=2 Tax=Shewanella psychropiezotolerans TaxID=2593655 RepID=A0ABX5X8L4_9GAMM|nr:GNAT family N-acetyltransferase [Shewanella psychropiezotolerans]